MPGRHNRGLASETPGAAPPRAHRPLVQQKMVDATQLWKMLTGPKACPMRLTSRDAKNPVRGLTTTCNSSAGLQSLTVVMVHQKPLEVQTTTSCKQYKLYQAIFWIILDISVSMNRSSIHPWENSAVLPRWPWDPLS